MTDILSAARMQAADRAEIARGTPSRILMERAAKAALKVLSLEFDCQKVLFLCGNGNNGGDGFAMARFFAEQGGAACVCYLGACLADGTPDTAQMSEDCATQYGLLPSTLPLSDSPELSGVTAVVDAVFGIGLSRAVEGKTAAVFQQLNQSKLPVLALDIPSGVHADSAAVLGTALKATRTVSMTAYKYGHLLYPGTLFCGRVSVADIGIPVTERSAALLDRSDLERLPPRPPRAHKGTFGRVLVIGGSVGMSGAGYFSAKAAYRAGAGLVEIFAPEENRLIYQTQLPEALLTPYDPRALDKNALRDAISRADAIAIGMGLGTSPLTVRLLETVLNHAEVPLVLDADALNVLAEEPQLRLSLLACKAPVVLTPHLGEASRLLHASIAEISALPCRFAERLAKESGAVTVLKDARTLICDGERLVLNPYGNSGMATGGSGDVLSGVIAALLAAKAEPFEAAQLGVLLHALAGDAAVSKISNRALMASDMLDALGSL